MKLLHVVSATAVLTGAIAAASAGQPASKVSPLRVGMIAVPGGVELSITNTSGHTVRMPTWQLPSNASEMKLFDVSRDGQEVQYTGRLTKFSTPSAREFAVLKSGQTYRTVVDLSRNYDMSQDGEYVITFAAPLQYASLSNGQVLQEANGLPMVARSAPLQVWMQGKGSPAIDQPVVAADAILSNGVNYVGCSSTQISAAGNAVTAARDYAENAKGYLNAGTVGPRYTTWFGAYTSTYYSTAAQHFAAIDAAMDQGNGEITINCGCTSTSYAYVYPTQPYQIYVCNAFWNAGNTGTDSRAGTLVHEMSHFNVVAGTDDHAYGQTAAKKLARTNSRRALDNADNHEYFAENTPFQN